MYILFMGEFLGEEGNKKKWSRILYPPYGFFFSHKVYFITKKRKQRHKIINRNEKQIMRQSHKWIYKSQKECQSCFSSKIMKTSFMHTLTRFPFTKNIKMWKKNQENTNYLMAGWINNTFLYWIITEGKRKREKRQSLSYWTVPPI